VEGRLQSRSWEDNSGQKRSVIEVRSERVQFLGAPAGKAQPAPVSEPAMQEEPLSTESAWLEESEEKPNEV
jgi:single-stranded DNA-binding protein